MEHEDFAGRMGHLDWFVTMGLPKADRSRVSDEHFVAIVQECIESIIWWDRRMTVVAQCKAKYTNTWIRVRRQRDDHFVVEFLSTDGWAEVPILAANTRLKAVSEMRRLAACLLPDNTDPNNPAAGGWVAARQQSH